MKSRAKLTMISVASALSLGCLGVAVPADSEHHTKKVNSASAVTQGKTQAGASKPTAEQLAAQWRSYTPARPARLKAIGTQVQSLEKEAQSDMAENRYAQALAAFNQEHSLWKTGGFSSASHHPGEIECYFQLGNYPEVVKLSNHHGIQNAGDAGAVGISLIKQGDLADAAKLYKPDAMITRSIQNADISKFLPRTKTAASLEYAFYLARGINKFWVADFAHAKVELEAANSLKPNQPLTAYYLGTALNRLGDTTQAIQFAPFASKLGGPFVQLAQDMSRPTVVFRR
jgi:tetratricopeptide (TPR) repeat protein